MDMARKAIDEVEVGLKTSSAKVITEEDVRKFAEVSGDFNALHLDEEYAKRTVFRGRIAHGILTLGLISAALAKLPGVVVYVSQDVRFRKAVKIGDVIEAVAEVIEKDEVRCDLKLKTYCRNQHGEEVLDGEARVRLFDLGQ